MFMFFIISRHFFCYFSHVISVSYTRIVVNIIRSINCHTMNIIMQCPIKFNSFKEQLEGIFIMFYSIYKTPMTLICSSILHRQSSKWSNYGNMKPNK